MVHVGETRLETKGFGDFHDITESVRQAVADSGVGNGIACVANPGSTAGITTIEYEDGALADLARALEVIAPQEGSYRHDARWHDGNGFAHLRSALVGTSRSFPVVDGTLELGTWQQVLFIDFDNRPRRRSIRIVVVGEPL